MQFVLICFTNSKKLRGLSHCTFYKTGSCNASRLSSNQGSPPQSPPCLMSEFYELQYLLLTINFTEATKKITKEGLTLPGLSTSPNSMGTATTNMKTKETSRFHPK